MRASRAIVGVIAAIGLLALAIPAAMATQPVKVLVCHAAGQERI